MIALLLRDLRLAVRAGGDRGRTWVAFYTLSRREKDPASLR